MKINEIKMKNKKINETKAGSLRRAVRSINLKSDIKRHKIF